jgi:hypothetical protein
MLWTKKGQKVIKTSFLIIGILVIVSMMLLYFPAFR